jgi:hypothetical protein
MLDTVLLLYPFWGLFLVCFIAAIINTIYWKVKIYLYMKKINKMSFDELLKEAVSNEKITNTRTN